MKSTALGSFVIQAARGKKKTVEIPTEMAQEVRDQLTSRICSKIDEIRASQRRAFEESKSVTSEVLCQDSIDVFVEVGIRSNNPSSIKSKNHQHREAQNI